MRQVALQTVFDLARMDRRVLFVGSDLGAGTLKEMKEELPDQFLMEGISEQFLIGFVSGLAKEGYIPFVNTIANFFTRRAYEQIAMDIALHHLPVRLLASGGGMVYAPLGPTHTAIDDLSLMSSVPSFRVFAPGDENEMRALLSESLRDRNPWYVRFGKGDEPIFSLENQREPNKPKVFGSPTPSILFLTTGIIIHEALRALANLQEFNSNEVAVVHFPEITAIDIKSWKHLFIHADKVIVAEEHIPTGGLFTKILHTVHHERMDTTKLLQISLPFAYSHNYGSQKEHLESCKLDAAGLIETVRLM